jgi:hypothetical protein
LIVIVDGVTDRVRLDDAEDVITLCVGLHGCGAAEAGAVLGHLGWIEGGHVWLDVAGLRALSPLSQDPALVNGFHSAMAYARSRGWIDPSGCRVRAHLRGLRED